MLPECLCQQWARDTAGTVRWPVAHLQRELRRWVQLAEGHARTMRAKQEPCTWGEGTGEPGLSWESQAVSLSELACSLSCARCFGGGSWLVGLLQFSSVAQLCPNPCDPMNCSMPGLPVHHQLPEFTQTHVHRVSDTIQPSHPLLSPSPPAPNPSQHQSLFQWVSCSHQVDSYCVK